MSDAKERYDSGTGEVLTMSATPGREPPPSLPPMPAEIIKAILGIMGKAKQLGFDEKNAHGGYSYVSIDKFLDTFRPLMAEAGLIAVANEPEVSYVDGGPNREGRVTKWLMARYEVWLYHSSGASWGPLHRHIALPMTGAQSFGAGESFMQKRLMRALFMVPTGDKDADAEAQAEMPAATRAKPAVAPPNAGAEAARALVMKIRNQIRYATTLADLEASDLYLHDAQQIVESQDKGAGVWADLVRRYADKQDELAKSAPDGLEDFDP